MCNSIPDNWFYYEALSWQIFRTQNRLPYITSQEKKTQHYPASATQICILITWSKCNYTSNNAGAKPEIWSMYIKQYSVATEFKTKT